MSTEPPVEVSAVTGTTLTICHDYESGTSVQGTTRYSPAHEALTAHRSWAWSRYATAWLLRSSRHRRPKSHEIDAMERILIGLGYTVERDIDAAMPTSSSRKKPGLTGLSAAGPAGTARRQVGRQGCGDPPEGR